MVARTLQEMRACGIDVLVGASPASVADLADYRNWLDPLFREHMMRPGGSAALQQALVVLTADGEVILLAPAAMAANAAGATADRIAVWGADPEAPGGPHGSLPSDPPGDLPDGPPAGFRAVAEAFARPRRATRDEALAALLDDAGAAARVGVEREALPAGACERIAAGGRRIGDCTNLLRLARMTKSEAQIALLERAAAAAEYAAAETLAVACAGSSWRELSDLYRLRLAEHGADLDHFAGSPTGYGLATDADFRLPERGCIAFDHGCRLRSWFSDTGHTIAIGPPDRECRARQAAARDALLAGAEQLAPGRPASAAAQAMRAALTAAGLTGSPHGHGIGLEVRDYPILVPDTGLRIEDDFIRRPADLPLETGMVINLEAPVWAAGAASVHVERSFVIESGGCRPLTDQPRDEPLSISAGT